MNTYLLLWLSVYNGKEAGRLIKKYLTRLFLPYRILEPLIVLSIENRSGRVYAGDDVPDSIFSSIPPVENSSIAKYIRPCSALIIRTSDLYLVRLLGLPGFVTDMQLNRIEHRNTSWCMFLLKGFANRMRRAIN